MPDEVTITVKLIKPAKKSGGDKYESDQGFVIYIPQYISRPDRLNPSKSFTVTFKS